MKLSARDQPNTPIAVLSILLLAASLWMLYDSVMQGGVVSGTTMAAEAGSIAPPAPTPDRNVAYPMEYGQANETTAPDQNESAPDLDAPAPASIREKTSNESVAAEMPPLPPQEPETAPLQGTQQKAFDAGLESSAPAQPESASSGGLFSNPFVYFALVMVFGLILLLSVFRVSFSSAAPYDSSLFKALSSDTRMQMLCSLQSRRMTLTELAGDAGISVPGAKQHLQLLEEKGLVRKVDEGRKWKYYELTEQGRSIASERSS